MSSCFHPCVFFVIIGFINVGFLKDHGFPVSVKLGCFTLLKCIHVR